MLRDLERPAAVNPKGTTGMFPPALAVPRLRAEFEQLPRSKARNRRGPTICVPRECFRASTSASQVTTWVAAPTYAAQRYGSSSGSAGTTGGPSALSTTSAQASSRTSIHSAGSNPGARKRATDGRTNTSRTSAPKTAPVHSLLDRLTPEALYLAFPEAPLARGREAVERGRVARPAIKVARAEAVAAGAGRRMHRARLSLVDDEVRPSCT